MLFTSFYEKSFIIHKMFKEALKGNYRRDSYELRLYKIT